MAAVQVVTNVTTNTTTSIASFRTGSANYDGRAKGTTLVQIDITGTLTVSLQGRLHEDAAWQELASYTASDIDELVLPPYTQVVTTNAASATLNMWYDL